MTTTERLYAEYCAGKTLRDLAAESGCKFQAIYQRFARAGYTLRARGERIHQSNLAEEIATDLRQFPEGVTTLQLAEWLGEDDLRVERALMALVRTGRAVVVLLSEPARAAA